MDRPTTPCRIWEGARDKDGYGTRKVKGRKAYAHRVAWEQANGPIPDGLSVLHRCDIPWCDNPDHLYLGTHQDNMRDLRERGVNPHVERWRRTTKTPPAR